MTRKQIIDAAERVGWMCEVTKEKNGWLLSFNTYSPCSQDVYAEIIVRTLDKVADEMHEYWQSYDPEEEAAMWYGQNRGEPKSLRQLLADMDWVDEMLHELSEELYKL